MLDQVFDKVDFTTDPLQPGEYEDCSFLQCDLSGIDLGDIVFIGCRFKDCNLSMAKLHRASFREVSFEGCKMVGLHFEDALPLLVPPDFLNCNLHLSSFVELKLQKVKFTGCQMEEVDFTGANLSEALFDKSNLSKAVFSGTVLEKADLRTALHYSIDPNRNKIRRAKFSLEGVVGLLDQYHIVIE
jgi:uncharacterized protein YjbI with pentapeptide repeats